MLNELQELQTLIKQLNTKYTDTKKSLQNVQAKPMVDASEVQILQLKLSAQQKNYNELQNKYDDLAHEMTKLKKRLLEKTAQSDALTEQVTSLAKDKKELLSKNEISSQRAQTILERLAALDQAGGAS